jgi:eukaryotic-like serine/threonine-protein kinase
VEGILAMMIPLTALFIPIYVVKRRYDLREQERRQQLASGTTNHELEAMREERKLLQARIENLESIVCSVDHELNLRIEKLLSESAALGPGSPQSAPAKVDLAEAAEVVSAAAGASKSAHAPTAAAPLSPPPGATAAEAPKPRRAERRAHADSFAAGARIGDRYRVERLIGRGGMGAVYLAHDEVLGDLVALKLISSAWSTDPEAATARFRREASAARRISSPNVIRIHDLGETRDGLLFISMEYVAARTLADLLDARGSLTIDDTRDIIRQVCDGLEAAHNAGVIHRDLKPQNILVGERNAVKIIDFGLAKTTFLGEMTATGLILGTPQYMSPEQVRGRPVDARSDIYALGALTYHTLTGRPPFNGDTPIAVTFAACTEPAVDPRELRSDVPAVLAKAILAALAKEPSERLQSVAEFRKAL